MTSVEFSVEKQDRTQIGRKNKVWISEVKIPMDESNVFGGFRSKIKRFLTFVEIWRLRSKMAYC